MKYTKLDWEKFSEQGRTLILEEIKGRLKHQLHNYNKTEQQKQQIESDILYLSELIRKADDVEIKESVYATSLLKDLDLTRKQIKFTSDLLIENANKYCEFNVESVQYINNDDYFVYKDMKISVKKFFEIVDKKRKVLESDLEK